MEPLLTPPLPRLTATAPVRAAPFAVPLRPEVPTIVELFEAEENALLRFAVGLVRRRPVAEELVQETFLRLHQVWSQVENPRAWLYRSLRNLALNHLRDQRPETDLVEDTEAAPENPPDAALDRMEAIGLVRMLLAEMPEDDRRLVQLKYHDGLKYQQIAKRTGISIGHVGYKLHHLLKGLADALRRAGIEGSGG
jgi:RNA polymerase sigma factor (sigma-70 family)